MAPIISLTKPGGLVCLSGIRREELTSVARFYDPYIEKGSEKTTLMDSEVFGDGRPTVSVSRCSLKRNDPRLSRN